VWWVERGHRGNEARNGPDLGATARKDYLRGRHDPLLEANRDSHRQVPNAEEDNPLDPTLFL